jgi:hypothetical protein
MKIEKRFSFKTLATKSSEANIDLLVLAVNYALDLYQVKE